MVRRAPGACEARVYDVSARANVPLQAQLNLGTKTSAEALRRAQRKHEIQNKDSNLLHEFEMPTVSNRIKLSRDGQYIFTSGAYPPQIHVYDTEQLSLKFKRHVDSDVIDFQILDDDWRKFVLVTADRYLDFHSPFGSHFKIRVPTPPRDLMVHRGSADAFVAGLGSDVWRFNAEQGRFLAPLSTKAGLDYSDELSHHGGINACGYSPVTHLLGFAGANGLLDIYDPRIIGHQGSGSKNKWQNPVASLNVVKQMDRFDDLSETRAARHVELTALRFDGCDGVSLSVGTNDGRIALFDLRASMPLAVRHQGNGLPIRSIRLHDDRTHCISADAKSIKVWRRDYYAQPSAPKTNLAVVEPDKDINHVCVVGNSGVICAAVEAPRMKSFYIPALGTAPKWCAFLDTFTEELEGGRGDTTSLYDDDDDDIVLNKHGKNDGDEQVYENYKFVTKEDLEALNISHLIGSDVLKAYMHGYFIHQRLYKRAREAIEPFAYEKWRKQKARDKINELQQSRITKVRAGGAQKKKKMDKVQVNQNVVDALVAKQQANKKKNKDDKLQKDLSVLHDDRFSKMFQDKDFTVDEDAERFQFLNPGVSTQHYRGRKTVGHREEEGESDEEYLDRFELVDDKDGDRDGDDADDSDDGEDNGLGELEEGDEKVPPSESHLWSDDEADEEDDDDDDDEDDNDDESRRKNERRKGRGNNVKMYELGKEFDGVTGGAALGANGRDSSDGANASRHVKQTVSLEERLKQGRSEGNDYSRRRTGKRGRGRGRR